MQCKGYCIFLGPLDYNLTSSITTLLLQSALTTHELQCRPYICHRSENLNAYFKEQEHYQSIIILTITYMKYNIFRNFFQSINSNFEKYYYF